MLFLSDPQIISGLIIKRALRITERHDSPSWRHTHSIRHLNGLYTALGETSPHPHFQMKGQVHGKYAVNELILGILRHIYEAPTTPMTTDSARCLTSQESCVTSGAPASSNATHSRLTSTTQHSLKALAFSVVMHTDRGRNFLA